MKSYAFSAFHPEELETGIREYIRRGAAPTLAIVFSSVDHDMTAIGKIFAGYNIDVFGASSCGEIVNGRVTDKSIAVMLLDINRKNFMNIVYVIHGQPALDILKKYFNISDSADISRVWEFGFVLLLKREIK